MKFYVDAAPEVHLYNTDLNKFFINCAAFTKKVTGKTFFVFALNDFEYKIVHVELEPLY